jgi:hypothetical protein
MTFIRTAEVVLGYTLNHFTLKNLLQNDRHLYRQIFELRAFSKYVLFFYLNFVLKNFLIYKIQILIQSFAITTIRS